MLHPKAIASQYELLVLIQ